MMKAAIWAIGLAAAAALLLLFVRVKELPAQTASITMLWTVPQGTQPGAVYSMRFSPNPVGADTSAWWNQALVVPSLPTPGSVGATDSVRVAAGLSFSTTYRFMIQTCNQNSAALCSPWSNVAVVNVGPAPPVSPFRILDLRGHN